MIIRIALSLILGAWLLNAETPDRPERLVFKPATFEFPRVDSFKAKLKNGIPVFIYADSKGVPFVRLSVLFRGGSYLDPKGKEGLASLFGSQLRAGGTEKVPAEALDEQLEFMAGDISSTCRETSGSVSMQFMEKDLKEGMDLFMQVFTRPTFTPDRLELAKRAALQELEARNDRVESVAGYQMGYLLNGEQHFTAARMTRSSLEAITRQDLKAFHERVFHPANLVVVASGKFEKKVMLDLLNRTLGVLQPGPKAVASPKVPAPEFTRKPGIYVVDKDVPQSMVQFAVSGLRRTDADWHAAVVMNHLLGGGGFTSRLMKKIRSDEGLTYGIGTQFSEGVFWRGNWSCGFQTKNRSVAYALRLVFSEIDRIKQDLVSEEELRAIKDSLIQSFPSAWSNRKAVAAAHAQEHLAGWPEDWHANYQARIQAVTPEDVRRVAQKYLNQDQLIVLVVGKASEVEEGNLKDHPGPLRDVAKLPMSRLPLRDPLTMKPLN